MCHVYIIRANKAYGTTRQYNHNTRASATHGLNHFRDHTSEQRERERFMQLKSGAADGDVQITICLRQTHFTVAICSRPAFENSHAYTNIILNKSIPPRACRTCGSVRSVQTGGAGLSGMMNIFGVRACVCVSAVHRDIRNYIFSTRARSNKCFVYRIPISLNLRHCVPCARSTVAGDPTLHLRLLVRRTRACRRCGMH